MTATLPPMVHWEEGLFLRPHHLQRLQHGVLQQLAVERTFGHPHPWGLVSLEMSDEELANGRVHVRSLRAVMPGGLVLDVPGNADLAPIDVREAIQAGRPLEIGIGVPRWHPDRSNSAEPGATANRRIYRVDEEQCADENTGSDRQAVRIRRLNARLLTSDDDRSEYDWMPLMRVVAGTGAALGQVRRDPEFVPPCLRLDAHPEIMDAAVAVAEDVEQTRRQLEARLVDAGVSAARLQDTHVGTMLRFRAVTVAAARLMPLRQARRVHPFDWYIEIRSALAELEALHPGAGANPPADYDHERPLWSIRDVSDRLRRLLSGEVPDEVAEFEFVRQGLRFEVAADPSALGRASRMFLVLVHHGDVHAMSALVQDPMRFKLLPAAWAGQARYGVRLVEERQPPRGLPTGEGRQYFELQRTPPAGGAPGAATADPWDLIGQDGRMVLEFAGAGEMELTPRLVMPLAGDAR